VASAVSLGTAAHAARGSIGTSISAMAAGSTSRLIIPDPLPDRFPGSDET
jgi:hypothetical protein